eukprot:Nitzschia sp. Nitz4//scaffold292_size23309//2393//3679//NITZ4_008494-RA/size23309-processed-gene-0.11-mRNA-1//-1//CDS//3329546161//5480//frame0
MRLHSNHNKNHNKNNSDNEEEEPTPRLKPYDAKRLVTRAKRRLAKSGIQDLPCHSERNHTLMVPREEIQLGKVLGEGSFSFVYQVKSIRHQSSDRLVMKVLKPDVVNRIPVFVARASDLVREGLLLSQLSHPHLLGCRATSPNGLDAFADGYSQSYFLILDRLECTVYQKLQSWQQQQHQLEHLAKQASPRGLLWRKKLAPIPPTESPSLKDRLNIIFDLADVVHYLHQQRILHRDLKPHNMGLDVDGKLQVFDLDVCRVLPPESLTDDKQTFHFTKGMGSPRYMAPEVVRGDFYNAKADVYSFALVVWELLSLEKPFGEISSEGLEELVVRQGKRPECPDTWPDSVRDFLTHTWTESVDKRLTMKEVLERIHNDLEPMMESSRNMNEQEVSTSSGGSDHVTEERGAPPAPPEQEDTWGRFKRLLAVS